MSRKIVCLPDSFYEGRINIVSSRFSPRPVCHIKSLQEPLYVYILSRSKQPCDAISDPDCKFLIVKDCKGKFKCTL